MPSANKDEPQKHVRPEMELRISGLGDGEHPFEFEVAPEAIGLSSFEGTITAAGVLQKSAGQYFVNAQVAGRFVGECDRCLATVQRDIQVPLAIYYITSGDVAATEEEDLEVDVRVINPEEHRIVIDDEVRQALMVEVPIKILCSDACRGLCPKCGADRNAGDCGCDTAEIDPRWGKLADLFKDKPDSDDSSEPRER